VLFKRWYCGGRQNLVLKDERLNVLENPEKDEQDADILNPGKLNHFPKAWSIGRKNSQGN